jgi:hypothetical protein
MSPTFPNITECGSGEEEGGGEFLGIEKWIIGVIFGLLGSIAINTGNNIQSLGLMRLEKKTREAKKANEKKDVAVKESGNRVAASDGNDAGNGADHGDDGEDEDSIEQISPGHSRVWILGTCVFVSGSLMNFASYPFAPQSMLASLESVQFVSNLLFGKIMHGAEVTGKMWAGTVITLVGTITAVSFSSKVPLDVRIDDLILMWLEPLWLAYLIVMGGSLIALSTTYKIYEVRKKKGDPLPGTHIIMPIMYAVWSALFGTLSVCQAKVLGELLASNGQGPCKDQVFEHWFTYVSILLWVATVGVWLYRLNDALSKFNPLFIIPLLQCMFIFFAIVSGGIFFKEFNGFSAGQWVGFCFGVTIMFGGLVFLVPTDEDDHDDDLPDLPPEVLALMAQQGGGVGGAGGAGGAGETQDGDEEQGGIKVNPVLDMPPPVPSSPTVEPRKAAVAGGRRKSMALEIGEGLANLIAGGPITVDHHKAGQDTKAPNAKSGGAANAGQAPDGNRRVTARRVSLAGALLIANLEKQQREDDKFEQKAKMRRASEMYNNAKKQAPGGVVGSEVMDKVKTELKGVRSPVGSPAGTQERELGDDVGSPGGGESVTELSLTAVGEDDAESLPRNIIPFENEKASDHPNHVGKDSPC